MLQCLKSAIHGLISKSDKSNWLKIQNKRDLCASYKNRVGPEVLTKRIVGSGDQNDVVNRQVVLVLVFRNSVANRCNKPIIMIH